MDPDFPILVELEVKKNLSRFPSFPFCVKWEFKNWETLEFFFHHCNL